MGDRIGVLGEASGTTVGTATVYTCPTGKMARGRVMFGLQGNAGGASTIEWFINGLSIGKVAAMTASYYVFSIKGAGLRVAEQAAQPTGIAAALTVAPADPIYYLNEGDTVQYAVGGAALISMNAQFVGFEGDLPA